MSRPTELERLFEPQWAGGWAVARVLFALAAVLGHGRRVTGIGDAYGAPDMVFASGWYRLAELFVMGPELATAFWVVGMIGIAMIAWGGRAFHLGMVLWLVGSWALIGQEALNVKAYDRFITWIAIGMLLSPAGERNLHRKYRSPAPRLYLMVVFSAIYGSTGILKLILEPGWWTGEALDYHLVEYWHGRSAIGAWVSGKSWLTAPMGWWTVIFEVAFPFAVWFRKLNPWTLVLGLFFHLGLLFTMDVGPFGFVSISAYAVLLHPEVARALYDRFASWQGRELSAAPPWEEAQSSASSSHT